MSDMEFLAALEESRLPPALFGHREHVRAAFIYLERMPFGAAIDRMRATLQHYTAAIGRASRYHETVTVAFMSLVNVHRQAGGYADWNEFAARNPELFDSGLLTRYYAPDTLSSALARQSFVLERIREA
jgi:hypothetical protein